MTGTATRYLYVARHGEALPDESGLTEGGRRQAALLGRRLRDVRFTAVHHGPLPRAEQTARLIGDQLKCVPLHVSEVAGDYVPYIPEKDELPAESADFCLRFLEGATDEERSRGPALARQALELFTGPVTGEEDRYELVVTHNFLVAWLSGTPCTHPSGVGSASTTATRHSRSSATRPVDPPPSSSPTT